eukprot:CFRG4833T1
MTTTGTTSKIVYNEGWHLDFEGQRVAERLYQVILTLSGIIAVLYGYHTQSFQDSMIIFGTGFALTLLLVLPPWPFYARHPIKWLPADKSESSSKS